MTEQNAQEPTMEEILASIRRIISEDDAPAAETAPEPEAPAAVADAAPEPAPEPEPSPTLMDETPAVQKPLAVEDDVLELTDTYEEPASEPEPEPEPEPVSESVFAPEPVAVAEPEHPSVPTPVGEGLVGETAAGAAASAFAGLASTVRKPDPIETGTGIGPTVDELARALLKPMLKEWLDENLPGIVQAQVQKEVERIARNAG